MGLARWGGLDHWSVGSCCFSAGSARPESAGLCCLDRLLDLSPQRISELLHKGDQKPCRRPSQTAEFAVLVCSGFVWTDFLREKGNMCQQLHFQVKYHLHPGPQALAPEVVRTAGGQGCRSLLQSGFRVGSK